MESKTKKILGWTALATAWAATYLNFSNEVWTVVWAVHWVVDTTSNVVHNVLTQPVLEPVVWAAAPFVFPTVAWAKVGAKLADWMAIEWKWKKRAMTIGWWVAWAALSTSVVAPYLTVAWAWLSAYYTAKYWWKFAKSLGRGMVWGAKWFKDWFKWTSTQAT